MKGNWKVKNFDKNIKNVISKLQTVTKNVIAIVSLLKLHLLFNFMFITENSLSSLCIYFVENSLFIIYNGKSSIQNIYCVSNSPSNSCYVNSINSMNYRWHGRCLSKFWQRYVFQKRNTKRQRQRKRREETKRKKNQWTNEIT